MPTVIDRETARRIATLIATLIAAGALVGCVRGAAPSAGPAPNETGARVVRVLLGKLPGVTVIAEGAWRLADRDGRVVAAGSPRERITLSRAGEKIRFALPSGSTGDAASPLSLLTRSADVGVYVNQRRYRGALTILVVDTLLRIVNTLDV